MAFDREHWSSEGDLVTYARWAVEEIYFQLPAEERQRRPDFRISDRDVAFRVERDGYGPFEMSGKEGSTLAGRYQDSQRDLPLHALRARRGHKTAGCPASPPPTALISTPRRRLFSGGR